MKVLLRFDLKSYLVPVLMLITGLLLACQPVTALPYDFFIYPSDSTQVVTFFTHIDSLHKASQMETILAYVGQYVDSARDRGDSQFLLRLLMSQGSIWSGTGRVQAAETALQEAVGLAEAQKDSASLCFVLRWLSASISNQGRGDEATELNKRLLTVAEIINSDKYIGFALIGLAWDDLSKGNYAESAELYNRAIKSLEKSGPPNALAWALSGLSSAQTHQEDYDKSLTSLLRAAAVAEKIEVARMRRYVRSGILNNLAVLEYNFGDPSEAARHFQEIYQLELSSGNLQATIVPGANAALCLTEIGQTTEAIAQLEMLVTKCHEGGYFDQLGKVYNQLANTYSELGNHPKAADYYRQTLALGDSISTHAKIIANVHLAQALSETDSSAIVFDVMKEASRLLAEAPDSEWNLRLKTIRGAELHKLGRDDEALTELLAVVTEENKAGISRSSLRALVTASCICSDIGRPDSALVLLKQAAQIWESDRSVPLDPLWREQRGNWSRHIYTDLALLLLGAPSDQIRPERVRAAFDHLQSFKARTLLERIRGPGRNLDWSDNQLVDLHTIQTSTLAPGEILIDGFVGPNATLIFAVTRDDCRVLRLPAEDLLEDKLRNYYQLIATAPSPDGAVNTDLIQLVSTDLGQELFGDLKDLIKRSDCIIVALDGVLNLVPLVLLLPVESHDDRSVSALDTRVITRVPSATFLAWLRSTGEFIAPGHPVTVLAVAADQENQPALPGARDEVLWLSDAYQHVDPVISCAGRSVEWDERFAAYDVLHLAAHARANDQSPWRSSIALPVAGHEGSLSADQITGMHLTARLAVLASCETARGQVISGEGVLGLSTAFLSAGVPSVLATLWEVEDWTTARFMKLFYAALSNGANTAQALQSAQKTLREDSTTSQPYFWSGFVLIGNGDITIPLTRNRDLTPGWLAITGLIVVAFLMHTWRRRNKHRLH